jgi:hypothetical protein
MEKKKNITGISGRSDKVYEELNKLPLMTREYRHAMMRTLKDTFIKQLNEAKKAELEFCDLKKVEPIMTIKMYNDICDLLTRCKTIFQVEALARYIFDMNEIPDWFSVLDKAADIERVFPWAVKN